MPKTTPRRKSSPGRRPGPPKINDAAPILLKLPADLREHIATAAEGEGVSVSEWIRRACAERALRREWQRTEGDAK